MKLHHPLLIVVLGTLLAAQTGLAQSTPPPGMPADAEIRKILVERIDTRQHGVGIVVGVIDPQGRRVVAHGSTELQGGRLVDGDTVFEIGSATKVFTALLLADAVQRGDMALTDPIARYLPAEVKVPQRPGQQITPQDLATHTSSLPRLPSNLAPKDAGNPYADYSVQQLYGFLSSYELTRDIGSRYEYSNLGAGLLGHLLARQAGTDYEALVRARITGPLGMTSTAIALSEPLSQRLAAGHNAQRRRVPNWDLPTLAGAGALRSTANDLLTFLSAHLGYTATPLARAMAATLATRRATGAPGMDIALGWHVITTPSGREIVWHNGGTGGYRSFVGFDPKARTGVVVLSNMFTNEGVDDIGRHLIDPALPLLPAPVTRKEIAVAPGTLDRHVGRYELKPDFVLTITREGDQLFLQATGQPKFALFAETERDFFLKVVDAQVTFEAGADGRTVRLILHQGGAHVPAKRIE